MEFSRVGVSKNVREPIPVYIDTEAISRSSDDRASDDEFSAQRSQRRFAAGGDEIREKMKRNFTLRDHSIDTLSEPIDEHNLSRISELEGDCSNTKSCSVEKDPEHTGNCKKADCVTPITAKAFSPFSDPPSGEQMVDLTTASERTAWTHPMETGTEAALDFAPHAPRDNSGSIKRASHSNKWYSRRAALQRNFSANSRINSAKLSTQTHEAGGTFLSNLCDARPSAMSGFLGVTSAALAMARATSPEMVAKRARGPSALPVDDFASYDSCNCCCAAKVSNRCSSETNLISFASPIIIRTSHITRDNSTELVYPDVQHSGLPNTSRASMHISLKKTNTRGLSASLGDLPDSSNLLEPRDVFANNRHQPQCIEQRAPWPKDTRVDICGHNSPAYKYRTLSEESNDSPRYQDRKAAIAPVAANAENQEQFLSKCHYQQLEKPQYPNCAANRMRVNMTSEQCCPRCKYKDYLGKHALSANHLAGLPKRKYGIDEISYDFMRASGAISGTP
ncbi:Small conductance calcium-activated potassium channel protein 2 [Sparganum proliferum]